MLIGMRNAILAGGAAPGPTPAYRGLCFTAEAANSSVQLTAVGTLPAVTFVKSFDGINWEAYAVGEVIDLPSTGDLVYLAAGEGGNESFGSSTTAYHKFVINGLVAASGDITSLRRFDLQQTTLADYCYNSMFRGCTGLTSAPELPATTLANYCYSSMFLGCTGLTSAPELPATTLANYCYSSMFRGCTGLTSAPELPVTTLVPNCYNSMFWDCTGLTSAPELPATTLASSCYSSMFIGCTGLTSAPELPATTLADYCYNAMFFKCAGLTSAPELPATTLATNCYASMFKSCTDLSLIKVNFTAWGDQTNIWVENVKSTGTFYKPSTLPEEFGTDRIPTGWTVVNID